MSFPLQADGFDDVDSSARPILEAKSMRATAPAAHTDLVNIPLAANVGYPQLILNGVDLV